jgi:sigma-54 dependent transcriptional regulator, acetoin dehydrogenase operon transcriptional activator AcoR
MTTDLEASNLRPEIALAWRRAALSGLDPGMEVRETDVADVDQRSRLAAAAAPILDRLMDELAGTRFSVLLSDRTSRIITRRLGERSMHRALDRVLAVPGHRYLEEISGTNSLATAFELQKPIAVTGEEHFLDALKVFCCYGAPIIHPITRRVEGVLDVSGPASEFTPLLGPFVVRAAQDIEQHLLQSSRATEQRLLSAFQTHARGRAHGVLVFGENLILSNTVAADMVRNADHATLRGIGSQLLGDKPLHTSLTLTSGSEVDVNAQLIPDSMGGLLIHITAHGDAKSAAHKPNSRRNTSAKPGDERALGRVIMVAGEPGTGRTTEARTLAGPSAIILDAADIDTDDDSWLTHALCALRGSEPVLIDNIHTLPARLASALTPAVRQSPARVVLTSTPLRELESAQSGLAAEAIDRRELPPLRTYETRFAGVAIAMLKSMTPDRHLGITASALRLLAVQPWPGNLRELRKVLAYAAQRYPVGDITETDLPASHRTAPTRSLNRIEIAERDTIVSVLHAAEGNKVAAARQLGIGRTTLYNRLRRYRINHDV